MQLVSVLGIPAGVHNRRRSIQLPMLHVVTIILNLAWAITRGCNVVAKGLGTFYYSKMAELKKKSAFFRK